MAFVKHNYHHVFKNITITFSDYFQIPGARILETSQPSLVLSFSFHSCLPALEYCLAGKYNCFLDGPLPLSSFSLSGSSSTKIQFFYLTFELLIILQDVSYM